MRLMHFSRDEGLANGSRAWAYQEPPEVKTSLAASVAGDGNEASRKRQSNEDERDWQHVSQGSYYTPVQ
jgi:hypothetical protein